MGDIIEKIEKAASGEPYTGKGNNTSKNDGQTSPDRSHPPMLKHSLENNLNNYIESGDRYMNSYENNNGDINNV